MYKYLNTFVKSRWKSILLLKLPTLSLLPSDSLEVRKEHPATQPRLYSQLHEFHCTVCSVLSVHV